MTSHGERRLISPRTPPLRRIGGAWWFFLLVASICLEGLGRRFVPVVPGAAWYFLKDVVLVGGVLWFGVGRREWQAAVALYRPFLIPLGAAFVWVLLEMFNPEQRSVTLGVVGLRAYFLWWISPVVVATALRADRDRRLAIAILCVLTVVISGLAAVQFQLPGNAEMNQYAWANAGSVAGVADTGRVRVISTFSYLTGFTDFVVVSTPLLLALGLAEGRGPLRVLGLIAAVAIAATAPMSGSRGPVFMVAAASLAVFWSLGAFATKRGLALATAIGMFVALPYLVAPDAVAGVESRFRGEDTRGRLAELRMVLPPFAIAEYTYPLFGIGTGMMQNAREAFAVRTQWDVEGEPGRHLVELGIVGYVLIWTARLGLVFALARAYRLLRRRGSRATAGLALALAGLTFLGSLTFDHVWQALFFVACGFVLREAALVLTVPSPDTRRVDRRALGA